MQGLETFGSDDGNAAIAGQALAPSSLPTQTQI